jgi:hypothetical protein
MGSKTYYKAKSIEFQYLAMDEAKKRGYIPYAGKYKPVTELWMIENAVTDILKNGRDKYCLVKIGSHVEIWIIPSYYRKGFIYGHDDQTAPDAGEIAQENTPEVQPPETSVEGEGEVEPAICCGEEIEDNFTSSVREVQETVEETGRASSVGTEREEHPSVLPSVPEVPSGDREQQKTS